MKRVFDSEAAAREALKRRGGVGAIVVVHRPGSRSPYGHFVPAVVAFEVIDGPTYEARESTPRSYFQQCAYLHPSLWKPLR